MSMQIIIEDYIETLTEVETEVTYLQIGDFDIGATRIPDSTIEAKGDLIAGTGVASYDNLPIGADGNVLFADSTQTKGLRWGSLPGGLTIEAEAWIGAGSIRPSATAGCSPGTDELSTNKVNSFYVAFNKDTQQYGEFEWAAPSTWNAGTVTAVFYWKHPATTTNFNVIWGIQGRAYANDDALDQKWGTAKEVTDTGGTTNDLYISPTTAAITLAGSPAANQLLRFRVYRKAADAGDTLAVDAKLIGVKLYYNRA
ncbi:MAG TPA: hypothetical protein PKJ08_00095 [Candidatus Cloacimonadota bacterium]|nr:hypothetical protein [Candidatus Cloacimonadota bacterium]